VPSNDAVRMSSLLVYAGTFAVWAGIAVHLLRRPAVVILFVPGLGQRLCG